MVKRKVFFSFHYAPDNWRVGQVRNIWVVEGNQPVSGNKWEEVKQKGDEAIQKWIDENLQWRSCTVVLIWKDTAWRKWVNYEIEQSWNNEKWLVWIYIHNLKNEEWLQTSKGQNPFSNFTLENRKRSLSDIVKTYDPPYANSTDVYNWIRENLENLVEEAIMIRQNYGK